MNRCRYTYGEAGLLRIHTAVAVLGNTATVVDLGATGVGQIKDSMMQVTLAYHLRGNRGWTRPARQC